MSDLFLCSPVSLLCVAIKIDGKRRSFVTSKSPFLSFSVPGFLFCPTLLCVFLLLSSILFDTLDEVQLCIGHAFLNPGTELQPPRLPPFSHFYPVFPLVFPPVFLSANVAAPHSLSSGRDHYMGLGVCLMPLLFQIHHFISSSVRTLVILYVFICCLSSHTVFPLSDCHLFLLLLRTLPNELRNNRTALFLVHCKCGPATWVRVVSDTNFHFSSALCYLSQAFVPVFYSDA